MSEHKCGAEESLEKERQFFLDMVTGQKQKKKSCLFSEPLSSISTTSWPKSRELELAARHRGCRWQNTHPEEPFQAAADTGCRHLGFGIIITMWGKGKMF